MIVPPNWLIVIILLACEPVCAVAQNPETDVCPRPGVGSSVPEPVDLRSENGVLEVELAYRNFTGAGGQVRYCYVSKDGSEAPTLRLKPGDTLILHLKNEMKAQPQSQASAVGPPMGSMSMGTSGESATTAVTDPCASSKMTPASTNLHFHGLSVPAVCHQDDVLKTMIQPGDPPFEYRFQIPADEPPGLYWYHPHIHGFTKVQVLGGASGAMIVEGIERADRELAGLAERVMIVRDQDLINRNAAPSQGSSAKLPSVVLDREGDALNTGTGSGIPAKDLSINFVPVPYPDYLPAVMAIRPSERQLWRVLNASAITYLNLQLLFNGVGQMLGVVAVDGVPINENGLTGNRAIWINHVGVPPGGRIEFIAQGPPLGVKGILVTRSVNTGTGGENDPNRPLVTIASAADAPEPRSRLSSSPQPLPAPTSTWIGDVKPVRTRKLYFSEVLQDPKDPHSPTTFMLTVEGQPPKPYDMNEITPNIIVHQGDVEDWIIENRTQELHDFHIHQIHFMLVEWFGVPVDEPFLRDTVNVPFWDGKSAEFPMVRLRMDFRDANAVGTFLYHCHLLEHEDGGMMGTIRVEPRAQISRNKQ